MRTANEFIDACAAEVGYVESPINRTKFSGIAGHRDAQPWCHTFLVAIARQCGVDIPEAVDDTAYTPYGVTGWKRAGRFFHYPKPGDWCYIDFPGDSVRRVQHVGVVVSVNPANKTITTIEGNTSPGNTGSQSNGGGVYRRTRSMKIVKGYGRPWYRLEYNPTRPTTTNGDIMKMLIDKRDNTVWLFGCGAPKSLGGKPEEYRRLLALGIPSTEDDGLLIDFLRS